MKQPPLMDGIGQAMRHLAQRQQVISQNIANSDTPGFKAREVEKPDFSALVDAQAQGGVTRIGRPSVTVSSGMAALGASRASGGSVVRDRDVVETKPDGNNVTLEEQLLKMSEIQAEFTALTNLYRKQMSLMKIAAGRGQG